MRIIQLGCNDGNDDVYQFVKENNSQIEKLIILDALDITAAEIRYRELLGARLLALNLAINVKEGKVNVYYPSDGKSIHASLSRHHVKSHGHEQVENKEIEAITLNKLMEMVGCPDRLYVDIEGLDVPVLETLDLDRFKPRYIRYEDYHSQGPNCSGGRNIRLIERFKRAGYASRKINKFDTELFI